MKSISPELQAHKSQTVTSTCRLMRMERKDGQVFGFTNLDVPVEYDDGDGLVVYDASQGMLPSTITMQGALSVDNAEITGLLAKLDTGINPEDVRAGLYDDAKIRIYQVNYEDLSQGHEWIAKGYLGECTIKDGEVVSEFTGLAKPLKQDVCARYSITCRAQYGDMKCGKSLEWTDGEVTALGTDPTTQFQTNLSNADNYYVPGAIQFTSGKNAGRQFEVVGFADGLVSILLPVYYIPEVGDSFRIRIDCNKRPDETGCRDPRRWGDDWVNHYRGEPFIPVADGAALQIPGASR